MANGELTPPEEPGLALEAAITAIGTLLLDLERYHPALPPPIEPLRDRALALGDRARQAHHTGELQGDAAAALLVEGQALLVHLYAARDAVRVHPHHRNAVDAHARGDFAALASLLPAVFAGVEAVPAPPMLYWPVPWRRRNRALPTAELVDRLLELASEGLPADADAFLPGTDPLLPAVILSAAPPVGDPLVVELGPADLPRPLCRILATGDILAPCRRLRCAFGLAVRTTLDPEELEATPVDYPAFRRALEPALTAAGIPWREA